MTHYWYRISYVSLCLSLTVWPTCSHYRPPSQFTQTNGSTSWETLAGRLDSRSILMVSWWTEMYWGRTEITWNLTISKIFFVGSSVNQGAHARFQLASISTFKGALSPKTISHIYSYFWRQGKFMLWLTLASPSYFAVRKLLTFASNFFPLKIVADVTSSYLLFPAVNCRVHHSFQMFPAKNPWLVKFQNAVLSWKNNNISIKASKEHLLKRLVIFL